MDTTIRLIAKSATWQVMGLFSMTLVGYLFTGSLSASSGIAVAGSLTGFLGYFAHEKFWSNITWGQK
ncbi:hypothetical protein A9Q97_04680 [Rhodospirillales bacterium 47_12_T64]|nr:hypothetical protein A9Q97_04680 [Rhodospirillales bacterium 47_12_T64]